MNKSIATFLAGLLLCLSGNAALVATYRKGVGTPSGFDVMLSDSARAGIETKPSACEQQGKRRAVVYAVQANSREVAMFASGCWHYKNGRVYLDLETIKGKPLFSDIAIEKFTTRENFQDWAAYSKSR